MIKELIAQGKTKEEIIAIYMEQGNPRSLAEFIYAIETGEIDGDVISVDPATDETQDDD